MGETVGVVVGADEGEMVGEWVGADEGEVVGELVGADEGEVVGELVGAGVGALEMPHTRLEVSVAAVSIDSPSAASHTSSVAHSASTSELVML